MKAILNYAPKSTIVPNGVRIQNVDPVVSLQSMTYYLNPHANGEGQGRRSVEGGVRPGSRAPAAARLRPCGAASR